MPARRLTLFAAFALTGCGTALLGPILPALSASLHLTSLQSGRLFTAQFLGGFLAALAASAAVARLGLRGAALAALALIAIGAAASGWANAATLPVSLLFYGAGLGLAIPVITLLVTALTQGSSASVLSLLNFVWSAGAIAIPSIASAVLLRWTVPALFFAFASIATLMLLAVLITVSREIPVRQQIPRTLPHRHHLGLAMLTSALLFLYVGTESSLAGWTPTWAAGLGASTYTRSAPASCFWAGILIARLCAPIGLRRLSPSALILSGLLLNSGALAAIASLHSVPALIACAALSGLGLGAVFPTAVAMFCDDLGPSAARSLNFVFAAGALGGATIPLVTGWTASLAPLVICTALMIAIELLIRRRLSGPADRPPPRSSTHSPDSLRSPTPGP